VISASISIPTSTSTSTSISISIYLSMYLSIIYLSIIYLSSIFYPSICLSIFHLSIISVSIYLSNEVLLSHKEKWHNVAGSQMYRIGRYHVKWGNLGSERYRPYVLSHMWKIDPKDKKIHKSKHDHFQTHM
jgi:hypothetical protein